MAIGVGIKKKSENDLTIKPKTTTAPKSTIATTDTDLENAPMTQEERDAQKLAVLKQQMSYSTVAEKQAEAVQEAESHAERMKNRSWLQKLFNIDPDAGFFTNALNAITMPFQKADDAVFSGLDLIQGRTKDAKGV